MNYVSSKLGVDSRLADDDDDPALQSALREAIDYANAHPKESKSIDEVRGSFQNGFPSRNRSPGHRRSCRNRIPFALLTTGTNSSRIRQQSLHRRDTRQPTEPEKTYLFLNLSRQTLTYNP